MWRRLACQTLSRALDISSATASVVPDLLKALAILLDTTLRRSAVDWQDLKPYWKSDKRPHFSRWSTILLFTSFSWFDYNLIFDMVRVIKAREIQITYLMICRQLWFIRSFLWFLIITKIESYCHPEQISCHARLYWTEFYCRSLCPALFQEKMCVWFHEDWHLEEEETGILYLVRCG